MYLQRIKKSTVSQLDDKIVMKVKLKENLKLLLLNGCKCKKNEKNRRVKDNDKSKSGERQQKNLLEYIRKFTKTPMANF